jgi:hypothetical protein
MAEKVVIDLEVDVNKSQRTLGQLEDRAEELNEELRKVPIGSKAFNELKQELVGVEKQIKNTELAMESLDNEQVAGEIGSVAGAVGDMTAAFMLLGGDDDSALAETARRIEIALGVTMAFKGAIEGAMSFQKLWNNTLKQTAIVQTAISLGTKIYAAAQGILGFAINAGTKSLKLFRIALISTGIGAIIVGIGLLASNFDKLKGALTGGIDGFKKLGVVAKLAMLPLLPFIVLIEAVKKSLQDLGLIESDEEIARQKRAKAREKRLEQERKARQERIEELEKEIKKEEKLRDKIIKKYDDEIRIAKSLGKDTVEIERLKLQAIIKSFEKQKELFEETFELRKKDIEQRLADAEAQAAEANIITGEVDKMRVETYKKVLENLKQQKEENNEKLKDAETDLLVFENEIRTEKRKERKKAAEEKKKEDDKEIEDAKKKALELEKIERQRIQNIQKLEDELFATIEQLDEEARQKNLTDQQKEIEAVQEKYFAIINTVKKGSEEQWRLQQYLKDEEAVINEKFRQQEKERDTEVQNSKFDLALNGLTAIMDLTSAFAKDNEKSQRRAFEINKRLQIAQAIISTYQGANNIFAAAAANPKSVLFPAQPFIAAGLAIVSGLANVATIAKQQFQGGSAGGGGVTTPNFNTGGGGAAPQIAPVTNTSTLLGQEPQQVFVTETDITNTQNQVAVIETQATIK